MGTDTSERGLERLICKALTGDLCDPPAACTVGEPPASYGGVGWSCGNPHDYNREFCIDLVQLRAFLNTTQPEAAASLRLTEDGPTRRKFLARLQGEITKRGTIDVFRHGIRHGPNEIDLFYGPPRPRTRGPSGASSRIASPSPASSTIASTRPGTPLTSDSSSTAFPSSPSSSRTASPSRR